MMKSNPSLDELISRLFQVTKVTDKVIAQLGIERDRIESYYSPRANFERWRDSLEGKAWKKAQYHKQQSCCASCKCTIEFKGSHIDHIKPLSKYPDLALDLNNLRICCITCNTSKQAKSI